MKTPACAEYEAAIADALYDAPSPEMAAHLKTCDSCREERAALQAVLARMERPALAELPEAYWHRFEQRVMTQIAQERPSLRLVRHAAWERVFSVAAAVALVLVGAVVGRMTAGTEAAAPMAGIVEVAPLAHPADAQARALRYLRRSKVLLLSLVRFDPTTDDPLVLNLPQQQAVARDLVFEAAFLQEDLAAANLDRLHRLVADLDVVLLQLANLKGEVDAAGLELVKTGVEAKDLLLKISLEELESAEATSFRVVSSL